MSLAQRFLFSLLILVISAACHRELAGEQPQGAVWVVDKPGQPGRLYLCGTIHLLRDRDYPLAPGYEAAYKDASRLVFELPPGSDEKAMGARMLELGRLPAGETLETRLKSEVWQRLLRWSSNRGLGTSAVDQLRPWMAALLITATEYAALGAQAGRGVDQHFEERAQRDGKSGEGLETVEFQLRLFSELSEIEETHLLEQTLAEVETLPKEFEKMIAAWKAGDLEALHVMLFQEAEHYPELMDRFLKNRNVAWMDRLEALLKNGETAMILVGAGHLASPDGLNRLLEKRGYRVRHYQQTVADSTEK